MKIIKGLTALERIETPAVLTIGSFDGVHLGHRALLGQIVARAEASKARSVALSFDPHPMQILRPNQPFARLFSVQDMADEFAKMNIDMLVLEPFTLGLSKLTPKDFISKILAKLNLKALCVGYDFAFGKDRAGHFEELVKIGEDFKFEVVRVEPLSLKNKIVSSSRIRQLIHDGRIDEVHELLTRNYYVEGDVVSGDGRGKILGFATANLKCETELKPAAGVYVTQFVCQNEKMNAVTNIGYKPTFYEKHDLSIESHVLDTNRNFVGQRVKVELLHRLRDELKFSSSHELIKQIELDVSKARQYFNEMKN